MADRFTSIHRIIIPTTPTTPIVRIVRADRSRIDQVVRSQTGPTRIVPNRIGQAVRKLIVRRQNLRKLPVRRIVEQVTVRNSIEIQQIVSQKRMTDQIQTEGMGDEDNKKLLQSYERRSFQFTLFSPLSTLHIWE